MDGIRNQIGPFMYADGALRRRTVDGVDYLVGIAGAYNAFGLIGTERNGLFVLDDTHKRVLLDEHMPKAYGGHGPTQNQWSELGKLMRMPGEAFLAFIATNPRYRGDEA